MGSSRQTCNSAAQLSCNEEVNDNANFKLGKWSNPT